MLVTDSTLHILDALMDDPDVEEFWVNDLDAIYFAQLGKTKRIEQTLDHNDLSLWIERQLMSTHRRLDLSSPFVDATLPDGSRLHVAIADVVRRGWSINVRKFLRRFNRLESLIQAEELDERMALILEAAVINGFNIVIAGGTGAGKTTLLNALLSKVPDHERILTCEEVCELVVAHNDWVSMQTRMRGLQGNGEIDLRELIRQALRMRPERLIVGEVRGAECLDLLLAFNSGQPGMATVHANSVAEAVLKLCTLPLLAGSNINSDFVVPTVARSVDLIVHVARDNSGIRRITEIGALTGEIKSGQPVCHTLLRWDGAQWMKTAADFPRTRAHEIVDLNLLWRGL
ncbi:MAG: hypothetical protein RL410_1506 [Actinomycetota bacterium]|jgi:pilus assembly protein CpaF